MSNSATSAEKRPVGRPRGDGTPHLTRERVFAVSAGLIGKHGFGGTSIRMIAGALKASPASLFHLFGSKADLLNDLIAFAAAPSLTFYGQIAALDLAPDVALYKSILEEVRWVASAERDQAALFYLPELRQAEFAPARQVRADMVRHFEALIARGCKAGVLVADYPQLAAEQVFQLTETSILAGDAVDRMLPDVQAMATADLCLRGLLADAARLDSLKVQAGGIALVIEMADAV